MTKEALTLALELLAVGTDDEIIQVRDDITLDIRSHIDFYRHCQAKSKEKNT